MNKRLLLVLVTLLFFFRIFYGLCNFWLPDNVQVYLLGLKYYTTGLWPYFGPDVTYTNSQIPGALQGLLVGLALYLIKIPESPFFFLQILVFSSLTFFTWYIRKRIPLLPNWLIWIWLLTAPWTMAFSTQVVNPSYVLPFAILFFVCIFELLPLYSSFIISPFLAAFCIGVCITSIMQIHMSWVLMLPYCCAAFYYQFRRDRLFALKMLPLFFSGLLIGALTLLPTLILSGANSTGGTEKNIVFSLSKAKYIGDVFLRFLSFASFEIPYVMMAVVRKPMDIIKEQLWIAPFALILVLVGWAQVGYLALCFFLKSELPEWRSLKILVLASILLVSVSFLFSIKGPSPHTFYIMFPLAMFYSFYCYQKLIVSNPARWKKIFATLLTMGVIFHMGIAIYCYPRISLYTDRAKVQRAISEKDYKIMGKRRADDWGYGY